MSEKHLIEPVVRFPDLIKAGYGCRNTILSKIDAGEFPAPMNIGGKPAWYASEIQQFFRAAPRYRKRRVA